MGMYDYIRVDLDLPMSTVPKGHIFQTKNMDCNLEMYVITCTGEIYKEVSILDDSKNVIVGRTHEYLSIFTNTICFYDYVQNIDLTYVAEFNCGRLRSIKRLFKEYDYFDKM